MPRGLDLLPAICLLLVVALPALAGPREDAAAAMARCDLLRDNSAWLDCHEKATAQMRAVLSGTRAVPPAPPPAYVPPRPADSASQRFGEDNLARLQRPRSTARKLVARVTDVSFRKTGYFTIGLDNGQWWRQTDGDVSYARFREPASRNIVTIEHGFMGSYNLHIQGLSQGYKVTRIR